MPRAMGRELARHCGVEITEAFSSTPGPTSRHGLSPLAGPSADETHSLDVFLFEAGLIITRLDSKFLRKTWQWTACTDNSGRLHFDALIRCHGLPTLSS